jgi:hypothetical protein
MYFNTGDLFNLSYQPNRNFYLQKPFLNYIIRQFALQKLALSECIDKNIKKKKHKDIPLCFFSNIQFCFSQQKITYWMMLPIRL